MKRHRLLTTAAALAAVVFSAACAHSATPKSFDRAKLDDVDRAVEEAIAAKRLPGGVLWIEHGGEVYHRAYGNRAVEPAIEAMSEDTIFDAASITKVVATAPSIWLLIERGKVALDTPVKTYLPELADSTITVRHLLTHSSGLRPSLDLRDAWSGYEEGVRRALAETPRNRPGAIFRYSDINYILLGEIVRRVGGEPLDVFARKNIFEPLGMKDSGFNPAASTRIAPTEKVDGVILRGVVHDPTSRRMGGVAGHAGLFTTASDLARFARVLGGPASAGQRVQGPVVQQRRPAEAGPPNVFAESTIKAMTSVQSPPEVAVRRAGGFDIDSHYARPRGEHFPIGSFGHTGWTGGFLWIDPQSDSFYVFLSNRVHPDGKGGVTALQRRLGTAVAASIKGVDFAHLPGALAPRAGGRVHWVTGGADVQNGIDVLHASAYEPLRGMRVGLITNHTGIDRNGNPTIDLLRSAPNVRLVALFSPEHGIRGAADDKIGDSKDAVTGLPIFSLYGERRKPSPEQLAGLDVLVFDIQDIGTRFYTYISTMGLAMEAAAEAKIKFVVLDRANPIGGAVVEGPILEGKEDFVGWHTITVRHGMTVGELAKMFNEDRKIGADLSIVQLRGWKREMWQDDAGLPWINTSPNMRSLPAAALYPGIGLMERALSVGRGTATPFEVLGAPFIDETVLVRELTALQLSGITFAPIRFTPDASVHKGESCGGVRMTITDRAVFRPVDIGVSIASTLARLYPAQFDVAKMKFLVRDDATLDAIRRGAPLAEIKALWDTEAFVERRSKYLLY
jgi:uncharacterized protein YbbC (DUF1343 family)/CubicO group peptidase (beta-lactamase class C family)